METPLEAVLMNSYKEGMLKFVEENPETFQELIQLSLSDKQPLAWRAAWLLGNLMEDNDSRLFDKIHEIIKSIPAKKDGHQRDLLRILHRMDLEDEQEGLYFDACVSLWEQLGKIPSVRFTALSGIIKTVKKYPELAEEVILLTQDHYMDGLSPGIKNAAKRMVKELGDGGKKQVGRIK